MPRFRFDPADEVVLVGDLARLELLSSDIGLMVVAPWIGALILSVRRRRRLLLLLLLPLLLVLVVDART